MLKKFQRGDEVVILDRERDNDWLNVIDVDSAKEGWVYVSHLKIYYTTSPKHSPPAFQPSSTEDDRDPEVTILNESNKTMNLKVAGRVYSVEPNGSRTLTLSGGTYKFFVSAPGVLPLYGDETFSKGYRYKWHFYVETVMVP